jgi:hypothetical protein
MRNAALVLAMVALLALAQTGCQQRPVTPVIHVASRFGLGYVISIYHPDTRMLYVWAWGKVPPLGGMKMACQAFQLSDKPNGEPQPMPCEPAQATPAAK